VLVMPALLVAELALLGVAARGGWLREKLKSQLAVLRALPAILERRRDVQARSRGGARELAGHLTAEVDSPFLGPLAEVGVLDAAQRAYWASVVRLLP
jgi:hypothetical protein